MKTAEQFIRETMKPIDVDYLHLIKLSNAMKEYAKQVAYESLKSAADKYIGKPVRDVNGRICAVSDDIMDTEITTP